MRTIAALAAGLLLQAGLQAADWPHFRGPETNGISPEKGINKDWAKKPPKELWRITLSDNGHAGPIVAEGKLFIVDTQGADNVVRAIDIKDGKEIWKFAYPCGYQEKHGNGRSSPAYENGKLYTISPIGQIHCLDAAKGTKIWAKDMIAEYKGQKGKWAYAASPFIDGDKLIVLPGGATAGVVALNKETGAEIWKGAPGDPAGYCTPVLTTIEGKRQYLIFTGAALMGVDTENGAQLWRIPWDTQHGVNAAAPIVVDNTIFIASSYGKGCGLVTIKDGKAELTYANKAYKAHFNSPILVDGLIYGVSGHSNGMGELTCLDPKTGNVRWSQRGFEAGGVVGVDGSIIAVNGQDGDVTIAKITPKSFESQGSVKPLSGTHWAAPIVAQGKLFVRNREALVALDLK